MILLANIYASAAFFVAGAVVCLMGVWWKIRNLQRAHAQDIQSFQEKSRTEAETVTRNARLVASEEALKLRAQTEADLAARQAERVEAERRLAEREALINSQLERMVRAEQSFKEQENSLRARGERLEKDQEDLTELMRQRRAELKTISGLNEAEAREKFLKQIEQEALQDASGLTHRILDDAKAHAEDTARKIISVAIQRYAGRHTFENTTTTIALPNDEIKGRIIGREGRNIRAFEAATGVTILVDDTPGAVVISGFDPVRREIARNAMSRLIEDGRIHPTHIEEMVARVTEEMDETIVRLGEEAIVKTGLPPMHLEVVKLLGRLHFRHSFSQNILDHSVEVAHLMGLMASELGIDAALARRTGLLHDIGKAVSHEMEGPHAVVGADLIRKYGESEVVVNGVASHHNDVPPIGPLGILVSAADAISASRPGARSESMTTYLKRVEDLEKIANSFPGVDKSYAVQAGRELRVFVQPEQISDEEAFVLARNIAGKIENKLQYPGQIKITVIRETRCVEVAK